jgi:nicotinate phosphoribosyltransferase
MNNAAAHAHDDALLTDLYQLTMLQAYFDERLTDTAVFELFVRRLPEQRNFLVAAGLEQALDYLENLSFTATNLATLARTRLFGSAFLSALAQFRFRGDVDAVPEGSVVFAGEPLLRVTAPLSEAQLVESRLINLLHLQTTIASKAARCVIAAGGKQLVDFGMRRAHGAEAALLAARANFLAGFDGTSTVLAKQAFDIPVYGTMAHSYIETHDSETAAFESFARCHRGTVVLLIDTYDTRTGAERVVAAARTLRSEGRRIDAVRLDSGDLASTAREVRTILDAGGEDAVRIFVSGGVDEHAIAQLLEHGAPIDGFGVGTSLDTSADAPTLDVVYKLQEYANVPRCKRSPGKATLPGAKQIYRHYDRHGLLAHDVLTTATDPQSGEPLLEPVMREGRRVAARPTLHEARIRLRNNLGRLPSPLRSLTTPATYSVAIAPALEALARQVDRQASSR